MSYVVFEYADGVDEPCDEPARNRLDPRFGHRRFTGRAAGYNIAEVLHSCAQLVANDVTKQIRSDLVTERVRDLGPQDGAIGEHLAIAPVVADAASTASQIGDLLPAAVTFEIRLEIPKGGQGDGSTRLGRLSEERLRQLDVIEQHRPHEPWSVRPMVGSRPQALVRQVLP